MAACITTTFRSSSRRCARLISARRSPPASDATDATTSTGITPGRSSSGNISTCSIGCRATASDSARRWNRCRGGSRDGGRTSARGRGRREVADRACSCERVPRARLQAPGVRCRPRPQSQLRGLRPQIRERQRQARQRPPRSRSRPPSSRRQRSASASGLMAQGQRGDRRPGPRGPHASTPPARRTSAPPFGQQVSMPAVHRCSRRLATATRSATRSWASSACSAAPAMSPRSSSRPPSAGSRI